MDWSLGRYERIAQGLLPAARAVVEQAAPNEGERVLDIGCGTGSGALLAAERGAKVTGIDPAERLLELARASASAHALDATFTRGEAERLPIDDATADAVISVFGVIFASDARAAVAEMARVCAPRARIVLTAWLPVGPIAAVMGARAEALAAARGRERKPSPAPAFAWHERESLAQAFAPHGFSVEVRDCALTLRSSSPSAFIDGELRDHPMWIESRAALEPHGGLPAVRERALTILEEANEDPRAFAVTSSYALATARRLA